MKTILDTRQDHEVAEGENVDVRDIGIEPSAGYVRGADYYAREATR